MEATCYSETSVDFNGLHGVVSQKVKLFEPNVDCSRFKCDPYCKWALTSLIHLLEAGNLRLGIDCARQISSFVYRVRVQHRSAAATCGRWSTLFLGYRNATSPSKLKSLCRGTKNHKVHARQCSFCRAWQYGIDFTRQNNEHCLVRQLRAIGTRINKNGCM
jgi:hypothetical protein